jgi:pSer/pThr/pTyr-binding forkhead associated (FHA) protein
MHPQIVLTSVRGPLEGKRFTFHDHTLCTIGRSHDCFLVLPNEGDGRLASRWHCLLDIKPPQVRVCDLGSLNGTYVNGVSIGSSKAEPKTPAAAHQEVLGHELTTGDALQVGNHVFLVEVVADPSDTHVENVENASLCGCS